MEKINDKIDIPFDQTWKWEPIPGLRYYIFCKPGRTGFPYEVLCGSSLEGDKRGRQLNTTTETFLEATQLCTSHYINKCVSWHKQGRNDTLKIKGEQNL